MRGLKSETITSDRLERVVLLLVKKRTVLEIYNDEPPQLDEQ